MTKHPSFFTKDNIAITLRVFLYLSMLRLCGATVSWTDIDLSTTTLDPLTTGFMITGKVDSDTLGSSVSTAGDINKDGYDDIIVGAMGYDNDKGAAYVIYGGQKSTIRNVDFSTLTLNPPTTGFMITGNDGYLGSVSTAGDINKDGYDDIVVGAMGNNNYKGAAYVIYGGPTSSMSNIDLSTQTLNPLTTGFMITGNAANDYFGCSVSTAGDINKDGYDDIIIGAYGKDNMRGAAYVIYGRDKSAMSNIDLSTQTLNPLTTGFMIMGNSATNWLGFSVNTAGDINNDGYSDIIIGTPLKNGMRGIVYVIYGGPKSSMSNIDLSTQTLNPLTTGFIISGDALLDNLGYSVSTAGDINQDGYDDIIVGAPPKSSNKGAVYVIYGGPRSSMSNIDLGTQTLDPLITGFMITGDVVNAYFGCSVSTASKINQDEYDDIIVGASWKNGETGATYVIYGGPKSSMSNLDLNIQTLNPLTTGFMITGNALEDFLGYSVSAVDLDHDGYSDILVGAQGKSNYKGEAYVIYACSSCPTCPVICKQCSDSKCTKCKRRYFLYQSNCLTSCPDATFISDGTCIDCPFGCSSCTSQESCQSCDQGYLLSNSLCILAFASSPSSSQKAQEKASHAISSSINGIGSVVCIGSATFPLTALVSKIVQNTRYLNLSVTSDLSEVYQTWDTNLISWDIPNVLSNQGQFKTSPILFARYELDSPFLANFWPTLYTIVLGFATFIGCIVVQKLFERVKYKGWVYSLVQKLVAGSFNFSFAQIYACLDDILFYLVLDFKTNPFNSFFSWASFIGALAFLLVGCLFVFFNFWTVKKYQAIKATRDLKQLEAFNERNKYWELFYSDFNDDDIWSQSFFATLIIRSTLSSLIITVFYEYALMQTVYLVILDGVIILLLYFKKPFNTFEATLCQYYFEIITLLVHLFTFLLSLQDSMQTPSEDLKTILSTGIMYLNTALIGGSLGFMFVEICKTLRKKVKAYKLKKLKEKIREDTQEAQNLTLTAPPEDIPPQRQNHRINRSEPAPIDQFSLLPGTNQNGNTSLSRLNMESSQILESSFNRDNSILSDMNQRRKPKRQKRQTTLTNVMRRQPRTLNQRQPKSITVNMHNVRNARPFENV